ncbi:MAG: UDP-glucose/GDP-mannose dehydrogenase family protein [Candidatus Pacebacteria bacterium]|jgi:UDPglucose 6-dehydrogenase|nr:UDP-glucose/GDP-mannose dehydrogenase family protein [Candidatus Paceibacterota bacterium]
MRIAVIGTGYVGLVSCALFAELNHQVIGLDVDKDKISKLKKGQVTIYEPGLESLFQKHLNSGKLTFTTDYKKAIKDIEVAFICVGTPPKKDGSYDSKYVYASAESIAKNLKKYAVIVIKSTVPPSTTTRVKKIFATHAKVKYDIASTPEFLREGSAINDALHPSRIVLGVESKKAEKVLRSVHKKLKAEVVVTTPQSAQLIKYASNSMLATKISFINAMAIICDKVDADINDVALGLGLDPRIGQSFLEAGLGYGGSCFPKDTWALIAYAKKLGYDFNFLKQVDQVNQDQIKYFITKIKKVYPSLKGKTLTVLGLAFKPNTDDLRESRSIELVNRLLKLGAKVNVYDPVANDLAKDVLKGVKFFNSAPLSLINSDGLVLATKWQEFGDLNLRKVKKSMKNPVIFDSRNFFDPSKVKKLGFKYQGIGRS